MTGADVLSTVTAGVLLGRMTQTGGLSSRRGGPGVTKKSWHQPRRFTPSNAHEDAAGGGMVSPTQEEPRGLAR